MNGVTGRRDTRRHLLRSAPATPGEMFVRHVADDAPFPYDFAAGACRVRVAEAGLRSPEEGRRIELEPLDDHT